MEKIITVDVLDESTATETYNNNMISSELITYIIDEAKYISKKDKIKIIINKEANIKNEYSEMIKKGFERAYIKSMQIHHIIDFRQVFFGILGVLILFGASFVNDESIWKEILLIGSWVLIWETIELELFSDAEERRKRKILKNLMNAEIIEE